MRGLSVVMWVCCLCACTGGKDGARFAPARALIANNCGGCHQVPGVSAASGRVGPSLAGVANQQILAGHFSNTPDNMARWIEQPQQMLPGNVMPDMGLTHAQAHAIADYLYTLD